MISKTLFSFACSILVGFSAFGGFQLEIKGKVLRIENSQAVIKTTDGETKIAMKRLSKKDVKAINEAIASKNEITLKLPPQVLEVKPGFAHQ